MNARKLTRRQLIRLHRELWDWLSHHPSKDKHDWPRWEKNEGDIPDVESECFACQYMLNFYGENANCGSESLDGNATNGCPLFNWGCDSEHGGCLDNDSPYMRWSDLRTGKTRSRLAAKVRDLPLRRIKKEVVVSGA